MNIFHRYVIREHIVPFFFAFSVIMFVLILKLMLELMPQVISAGVSFIVIVKLFVYNLAWMVALVVPMSVLVASVMAFGRMGASGEIIALKAAGISMYRIVSPVIFLAILLTIIMIWFNNKILPEANYRVSSLVSAVVHIKPIPTLKNREGQFFSKIPNLTLRVEDIDSETEEIFGVTLFRSDDRNSQTIITAQKGHFVPTSDRLTLILNNGVIHKTDSEQPKQYIRTEFNRFKYVIKNLDFGFNMSRRSPRNDRTMTTPMMRKQIENFEDMITSWEKKLQRISEKNPNPEASKNNILNQILMNKKRIAKYLIEINKKNSIPFASIVFVLIGASLGILVRRSGASIGIGMSIGFFTLYYMFLIGGESLGDRLIIAPWLAMWAPNIVLGTFGIWLFRYAVRR